MRWRCRIAIFRDAEMHYLCLSHCITPNCQSAYIPMAILHLFTGQYALKRMSMSDCTYAMSDCISQMPEFHFG